MNNPFKDWTPAMIEAHNAKILARHGDKGLHAPTRKVLDTRQGLTPDGPLSSVLAKEIIHENHSQLQSTLPKRIVRNGTLGAKEGKTKSSGRFHVRITSYRSRLTDPDNLCGKWLVDCLRYCGVLRDDTAKDITYSITQEKVSKEKEHTVIEVSPE